MIPTPDARRRVDLLRRRAAISDRLSVRELEAAQKGISTPPEVVLEVEDLRHDLRKLDEALRDLDAAYFIQPDLTPAGMYDAFVELRADVQRALSPLYSELLHIRSLIVALNTTRSAAQDEERVWRRRVLIWLAILSVLVSVVALRNIFTITLGP